MSDVYNPKLSEDFLTLPEPGSARAEEYRLHYQQPHPESVRAALEKGRIEAEASRRLRGVSIPGGLRFT